MLALKEVIEVTWQEHQAAVDSLPDWISESLAYVSHVIGIASIALDYGADEDEGIAALLHDAIEDAPDSLGPRKAAVVRERILGAFGPRVLDIVAGCTDADVTPKPAWRKRKEDYIAHIADASASVAIVSASDKLHNARAVLKDFRAGGINIFDRFNREAGVVGTIGYYCGLVAAFQLRAPQLADARLIPLIAELARTVSAIEHETGVAGVWPLASGVSTRLIRDTPARCGLRRSAAS